MLQFGVEGVFDSTADFFSWATIGYGIHPGWAILESAGEMYFHIRQCRWGHKLGPVNGPKAKSYYI